MTFQNGTHSAIHFFYGRIILNGLDGWKEKYDGYEERTVKTGNSSFSTVLHSSLAQSKWMIRFNGPYIFDRTKDGFLVPNQQLTINSRAIYLFYLCFKFVVSSEIFSEDDFWSNVIIE